MIEPFTSSWIPTQILFFLRFIQLGSTVLTGFIAIYFVYWHDILHTPVPTGLIILISTLSISFLESYLTSAYFLFKHTMNDEINYRLLLKTTIPSALLVAWGYYSLRHVPYIREWCEGDNWFKPTPEGYQRSDGMVEGHMCALTCTVIVAGGVALAFTGFVALFAGVGPMRGKLEKNGGKSVLGDEGEYEDNLLAGPGLDEKDREGFDGV